MESVQRPEEHPRQRLHAQETLGERAAGAIASFMGSWPYLILQSTVVALWIVANLWLLARPFDPEPFILLNLLFSTQASYAAPLLQLSANRSQRLDRKRDDIEAEEVDTLFRLTQEVHHMQTELLALQHTQMEILALLRRDPEA